MIDGRYNIENNDNNNLAHQDDIENNDNNNLAHQETAAVDPQVIFVTTKSDEPSSDKDAGEIS